MRVDPSTNQAAVLSFPRDLWVTIAGTDSESRINSAYVKDDPTKLIQTIYDNFGIGIDHFVQVDFCAFKTLVDAVGGVPVPFAYPARDENTGLDVPQPGLLHVRRRPRARVRAVTPLRVLRPRHQHVDRRPGVRPRSHLAPAGLPPAGRRQGAEQRACTRRRSPPA